MSGKRPDDSERSAQRRRSVLDAPPVVLRVHKRIPPPEEGEWHRSPVAVGFGSDGSVLVVWMSDRRPGRCHVAAHHADGGSMRTVIDCGFRPSFVQSMTDGHLLVAAGTNLGDGGAPIGLWSWDGTQSAAGRLGDGLRHLVTTSSGNIWAGYSDEAIVADGPESRGLVRYNAALEADWLYPADQGLPEIIDCYGLNVDRDVAYCVPFPDFRLVATDGQRVTVYGALPRVAETLLVDGIRGALVGGETPERDLLTPVTLADGVRVVGPSQRLVMPDGAELPPSTYACRGADLNVFVDETWYRVNLDHLESDGLVGAGW